LADKIRNQFVDEVNAFFVGPRSENELLPAENFPLDIYTTGILFPKSAPKLDAESNDNDTGAQDGENNSIEEQESETFFKQNSIGLKTEINNETKKIKIKINYGKYSKNADGVWGRHELDLSKQEYEIDLSKQSSRDNKVEIKDGSGKDESQIWWKIYNKSVLNIFLENTTIWKQYDDKSEQAKKIAEKREDEIVTFDQAQIENNENTLFQPSIKLETVDNPNTFQPSLSNNQFYTTEEDELFDMLYQEKKIFASGYGCAVEWEESKNPQYIQTSITPTFYEEEIAKESEDQNDPLKPCHVDMFDLACFDNFEDDESNRKIILHKLEPLVVKYRQWITEKQNDVKKTFTDPNLSALGNKNLKNCEKVLERIEDGLELLKDSKDNKILRAFVLTNRAMLYQRLHFDHALKNFKSEKNDHKLLNVNVMKPGQAHWYPFQIAFLLMSIRGIAFKQHPDNSITDLLWFPTGGGKTEAYLSVASFAMILRRLEGKVENGLGMSVLMRYTLRLLTLQQFERASTLICALEYLRRKLRNSNLGNEPFLLGLWVGYSLTPNHFKSSRQALSDLEENPNLSPVDGSPCQTNYCPWCGKNMNPNNNYKYDSQTKWTLVRCSNEKQGCPFSDRSFAPNKILPLVTVDSDIYSRCPSMIISTVDKFARMSFRSDIGNILGHASRKCELHGFFQKHTESNFSCQINGIGHHRSKHEIYDLPEKLLPPDLIIQDELHLISGSLGTMVGLYETAVDFLTTQNKNGNVIRPKIIVSTATAKGADIQVRKVFNRTKTQKFPPPGIERKDSFFWWETGRKGRMFTGISFSQKSAKFALAKLYATLLQTAQSMRKDGTSNEDMDSYWTLVGYYNSIRELGGSNRLVEDDVKKDMKYLAQTIHKDKVPVRDPGTPGNGIDELTGRKTQLEINQIRTKLEKTLPNTDVISVLLATNMIATGIDINRLALMIINGQPKTVTEYIQASGRIGRNKKSPGSVFVFLNPYKPRDLSHYQNFTGFHNHMQKMVEPSGLTPFSIPAYNRGLHSVLIAMIRLSNPRLAQNTSAHRFEIDDAEDASKFILERFMTVEEVDSSSESYIQFEKKLNTIKDRWALYIEKAKSFDSIPEKKSTGLKIQNINEVWYYNKYDKYHPEPKNNNVLMIEFAKSTQQDSENFPLSTPESLRDVEQQIVMEYV
jgi:hypothetical protein